jgi:hypothetical protein
VPSWPTATRSLNSGEKGKRISNSSPAVSVCSEASGAPPTAT